jgi:hypothetical protein
MVLEASPAGETTALTQIASNDDPGPSQAAGNRPTHFLAALDDHDLTARRKLSAQDTDLVAAAAGPVDVFQAHMQASNALGEPLEHQANTPR